MPQVIDRCQAFAPEENRVMNVYEIRVQGHLDRRWSDWFEGLTISYEGDGSTVLRGPLPDEAALHGVLIKVRDLALPLLGVNRMATGAEMRESHEADGGTNSETW